MGEVQRRWNPLLEPLPNRCVSGTEVSQGSTDRELSTDPPSPARDPSVRLDEEGGNLIRG